MLVRKNPLSLAAIVALAATGLFLFGCSSSDKPPTQTYGSNSDDGYNIVQAEIITMVDSTMDFFLDGFGTMSQVPADNSSDTVDQIEDDILPVQYGSNPTDSVNASYVFSGGWHVLAFEDDFDLYHGGFIDSVQFRNSGGLPQQTVDGLWSLTYKHRWSVDIFDTTVTHTNQTGDFNLIYDNLNEKIATFNGDFSWQTNHKFVSADSTTWTDISYTGSFRNFLVSSTAAGWVQSCPSSGSVVATLELTYTKDQSAPVITTWAVTLNFQGGIMYATLQQGQSIWKFNKDICSPPL